MIRRTPDKTMLRESDHPCGFQAMDESDKTLIIKD